MADAVGNACGGRCCVFSGADGSGYRYAMFAPSGDLRPLIQAMHAALQGRGGGKAQFVQGSLPASRRDIEAYFHANLFHSLGE